MWRRMLVVGLLLLVPGAARSQNVSERLLPGGSQIYFRWDGIDKHRAEFDKTAVGKMMKSETGKFLSALWTYANELLDVALRKADPKAAALAKEIPGILAGVHHHGFVLGVEVKSLTPPQVDGVLVFPQAGGPKGSLPAFLDQVLQMAKADVKETKVGKRLVHELGNEMVHFGWWKEPNNDFVLVVGTTPPADLAKSAASPKGTFAQSKTYAHIADFKEFPTWAQGHLNIAGLLEKVGEIAPPAEKLIDELGLKGLKGVTFRSGFSGASERLHRGNRHSGRAQGLACAHESQDDRPRRFAAAPVGRHQFFGQQFQPA